MVLVEMLVGQPRYQLSVNCDTRRGTNQVANQNPSQDISWDTSRGAGLIASQNTGWGMVKMLVNQDAGCNAGRSVDWERFGVLDWSEY